MESGMFNVLRADLAPFLDAELSCGSPGSPRSPQTRFDDIYQQSRLVESQDDRRRRLLKQYRSTKRDDTLLKKYAATFAAAYETVLSDEPPIHEDEGEDLAEKEAMQRGSSFSEQSPHRRPRKNKFPRLMLSEWLLEVPSDFEDNWIMMPCPVGKRCSIVTCKGETLVYSRTGQHMMTGTSDLPGGSSTKRQGTNFTVLDCVFDEKQKIFHLLDVLFWNGSSLVDNTVEFRLFWLQSRLDEIESRTITIQNEPNEPNEPFEPNEQSELNQLNEQFELRSLPQCACTPEELTAFFASTKTAESSVETAESSRETAESSAETAESSVDGFLFYHKEGLYVSDTTPLVCWLKPFMVSEILNIAVPGEFLEKKPAGFTNLSAYVASLKVLEEKRQKKRERRFRRASEEVMDVDATEQSETPLGY